MRILKLEKKFRTESLENQSLVNWTKFFSDGYKEIPLVLIVDRL